MANDKKTRRETLGLLGAGVTMLVGCGSEEKIGTSGTGATDGGNEAACAPKQESTVGPYPNIDPLERRDVRANSKGTTTPKDGAALTLRIRVLDLDGACAPIAGASVDVWHCDATGLYAGYDAFGTAGQDFCRGYQRTDEQGVAEFLTIFPGSYSGRAIHIHFSVQSGQSKLVPNAEGSNVPGVFVAQLYFERAVADAIFAATPIYQQGAAITPNEADGIYSGEGGAGLVARMEKSGTGYVGTIDVGLKRPEIGTRA
jgi:protocatechuate 3,4-dioxygenase beta subunit